MLRRIIHFLNQAMSRFNWTGERANPILGPCRTREAQLPSLPQITIDYL
jgi:hypothetical protein